MNILTPKLTEWHDTIAEVTRALAAIRRDAQWAPKRR